MINMMIAHTEVKAAIDRRLRSTSICFFHQPGRPCAKWPSKLEAIVLDRTVFCPNSRFMFEPIPFLCRGASSAAMLFEFS